MRAPFKTILFPAAVMLAACVSSPSRAFTGRKCRITVVKGETTVYKSRGRTWDRTDPGTPDVKARLQVGGYVFFTKMACNTIRPVWNETFEACLTGQEDGTVLVVDVDRVDEDVIGATEVKTVTEWFGSKVFRVGGKKTERVTFGMMTMFEMKIVCDRRQTCNPPVRKREAIQATFVWKTAPPRFLLYRVLVQADKLAQYKKDGMYVQLTHWGSGGSGFTQLKGVWSLPGPGQWNAFPIPLLCFTKTGPPKRTAKVVMEVKGSTTLYTSASGVKEVLCR